MTRCIDCHWFEHEPPVARQSKSCSELGELAQSKACENFAMKVPDGIDGPLIAPHQFATLEERKEFLGALMDEPWAAIFHEILAENFALSQDAFLAVKKVQGQLQTIGANIQVMPRDFQRTADKMLDILVTYRLACALGLGRFADEIIQKEIEVKFSPRLPPPSKG